MGYKWRSLNRFREGVHSCGGGRGFGGVDAQVKKFEQVWIGHLRTSPCGQHDRQTRRKTLPSRKLHIMKTHVYILKKYKCRGGATRPWSLLFFKIYMSRKRWPSKVAVLMLCFFCFHPADFLVLERLRRIILLHGFYLSSVLILLNLRAGDFKALADPRKKCHKRPLGPFPFIFMQVFDKKLPK